MVFNLRKPSIRGKTTEEQIKEIYAYLGYLAKELNISINDINTKINDKEDKNEQNQK